MHRYIKTAIITIALSGLFTSALAQDRFIVKYKLTKSQEDYLSSHRGADKKEAEEKIRKELMKKFSETQLAALSMATNKITGLSAEIKVNDAHSLATGAHVIRLSEDLDKTQSEELIKNVLQDNSVDYIGEDLLLQLID